MAEVTRVKDLLDVPERVHKGDFVLKLTEGLEQAEQTARTYVATPALAGRRSSSTSPAQRTTTMASPSKAAQDLLELDWYEFHCVPSADIKEHEDDADCWCSPVIDPDEDDLVYIHNALDGRDGVRH